MDWSLAVPSALFERVPRSQFTLSYSHISGSLQSPSLVDGWVVFAYVSEIADNEGDNVDRIEPKQAISLVNHT